MELSAKVLLRCPQPEELSRIACGYRDGIGERTRIVKHALQVGRPGRYRIGHIG